jgi:hypothetical protein
MGQVVKFPKLPVRDHPNVRNETLEMIKRKQMQTFAEGLTREFATSILMDLEAAGIDIEKKEFARDYSYSMDVLRCGIYRNFGISHRLQSYIDKNVRINEDEAMLEVDGIISEEDIDDDEYVEDES